MNHFFCTEIMLCCSLSLHTVIYEPFHEKTLLVSYANSLISIFFIRCLDSIINTCSCYVQTSKGRKHWLIFVAEQASLSLSWSQILDDRFSRDMAHNYMPREQNLGNQHLSHIMRKPVLAICEQQRCRSVCASTQSDQHLCFSLPG